MRLAVDFGGTRIKVGLVDEGGRIQSLDYFETSSLRPGEHFLDDLITQLKAYTSAYKITHVGLASKGGVDRINRSVVSDIGAGAFLAGKDLGDSFENAFKVPFTLENDARAFTLGEYSFGAGQGAQVMVGLTLGTGVGCSVLLEGVPYPSHDPLAGLLGGHISIDRNGPVCTCGNRGCLERYVSATALHEKLKARHPELYDPDGDALTEFFKRASTTVSVYGDLLTEFQDNLTMGLINIIHAYAPDTIVIGGGIAASASIFLPRVVELVHAQAWTSPSGRTRILASELDTQAALLGVAFHPDFTQEAQDV